MVLIKKIIKKFLKLIGLYNSYQIWPKVSNKKKSFFIKNIKLKTSIETLNDIKCTILAKERGAYLRFGDGDIYLLLGLDDLLHKSNKNLAKEMKEVFSLKEGKLHKALAINSNLFGFEKGMKKDVHLVTDENAIKYVSVANKFFKLKVIYTPIALHYLSIYDQVFCVSFLKFLKSTNPIFVGNEDIKPEIITKLFSNTHIKTPINNSYYEINRIENELIDVLNVKKLEFQVVIVAMGCSGRVLQKRILKKEYNVYLFDFGSLLDAFNGYSSRNWIDIAGLENLKKVLNKV